MRNRVVALILSLLSLIGKPHAAWSMEDGTTQGPPEIGRGSWLVSVLKQLADDGNLNDAAEIGRVLQLRFVPTDKPSVGTTGGECPVAESYVPLSASSYLPAEPNWFHPTGEGIESALKLAGGPHPVEPSSETKETLVSKALPRLEYWIARGECRSAGKATERSSAILYLDQIQAFTCITQADLLKFLPGARQESGLDGSVPYSYLGKRDADGGIRISFEFWGDKCLSIANIESGWRYGFGS